MSTLHYTLRLQIHWQHTREHDERSSMLTSKIKHISHVQCQSNSWLFSFSRQLLICRCQSPLNAFLCFLVSKSCFFSIYLFQLAFHIFNSVTMGLFMGCNCYGARLLYFSAAVCYYDVYDCILAHVAVKCWRWRGG